MDWKKYYNNIKGKKPSESLIEALKDVKGKDVLDMGAGSLVDTKFLLKMGYRVHSMDSSEESLRLAMQIVDINHIHTKSKFEDFSFEYKYDLINAQFALPFCAPEHFNKLMENIRNSLNSGGVFVGQFFGKQDEWATGKSMSFHELSEVIVFFKGYGFSWEVSDKKYDKPTAAGEMKHWHVITAIVKKK